MRRWMIWAALVSTAGLLGGSAIATPMSNKDYSTRVMDEVDLQNMTCTEIEYLSQVFNEMTGRCPPAEAVVPPPPPVNPLAGPRTRLMTSPINAPPPMPYSYSPPRLCPDQLPPTYRLSPEVYDTLGPSMRAALAQAGVPWDIDAEESELKGRSGSTSQIYNAAPVNLLAGQLRTAAALKNCRPL